MPFNSSPDNSGKAFLIAIFIARSFIGLPLKPSCLEDSTASCTSRAFCSSCPNKSEDKNKGYYSNPNNFFSFNYLKLSTMGAGFSVSGYLGFTELAVVKLSFFKFFDREFFLVFEFSSNTKPQYSHSLIPL